MTDLAITISAAALAWLATGERGLSSDMMFGVMTGLPLWGHYRQGHPHDPDDVVRCEKLLRAVPEWRDRLLEMGGISREWEALARNWGQIVAMLEGEVPGVFSGSRGSAPKTYGLMMLLLRP